MIKILVVLVAVLGGIGQSMAASDEEAVRTLLMTAFEKPESRLSVDPVVVAGSHALAG